MLKLKRNGDITADAFTVEGNKVRIFNTEKCPNLYDTAFIVWEALTLADIFTSGETLEPEEFTTYTALSGHNYYDTYTGTIKVGDDTVVTITNTGESAVTVYVIDMTTLFTSEPTETQLDNMYKIFMWEGSGSELLTIDDIFYVGYTNNVIHNLTTIYGTVNEPTLETHEALIPQYTNTVIKAPAFKNDLQTELITVKTSDKIDGVNTWAEFISAYQLVANGDFSDGTTGWSSTYATLSVNVDNQLLVEKNTLIEVRQLYNLVNLNKYYFYVDLIDTDMTDVYVYWGGDGSNRIDNITPNSAIKTMTSDATYISIGRLVYNDGTYEIIDNVYLFNLTALQSAQIYSPLYADTFDNLSDAECKAQLDLWVEIYSVLSGNTTKTGTAFLGGRYYVDYDNLKVYDYDKASPYVTSTPADKEVFIEDMLAHNIVVNFPIKARIRADGITILGDYVVIGQD
jgi:hypothetical protein